jgi:hypothetical protein
MHQAQKPQQTADTCEKLTLLVDCCYMYTPPWALNSMPSSLRCFACLQMAAAGSWTCASQQTGCHFGCMPNPAGLPHPSVRPASVTFGVSSGAPEASPHTRVPPTGNMAIMEPQVRMTAARMALDR